MFRFVFFCLAAMVASPEALPVAPSVFSAAEPAAERAAEHPAHHPRFVGSRHSDVYHHPACPSAALIAEHNLRVFSTPEAAREAEYRPCLRCQPPEASGDSTSATPRDRGSTD